MRTCLMLAIGALLAILGFRSFASEPPRPADGVEDRFRETVRPFLETYCVSCHGAKDSKGDINLSSYTSVGSFTKDLANWELVLEQLEAGAMPPAKARAHPTPEARRDLIGWIKSVRAMEAKRHAGDPGAVTARRLSNAEYDHTIRDLTGVDIKPTREFPVDPANKAGFDNSGESLAMSPGLLAKYLEAARFVADHMVLKPNGIAFAAYPVIADTDRDKYSVRRIIDFYHRQKTDVADYLLAAWKYQNREALGKPDASLADFAAEASLSPKYLTTVWSIVHEPALTAGPIASIQVMWKDLPTPGEGAEVAAKAATIKIREFIVELRDRLTPVVRNLKAPGISEGSQTMVLWKNRQLAAKPPSLRSRDGCKAQGRTLEKGDRRGASPGPAARPRRSAQARARLRAVLLELSRRVLHLGASAGVPRSEGRARERGSAVERWFS